MQENAWFTSEIRSFFLTARISKSREAKRKNKKKDRYIHLPTRRSSSTQVFAFKVFRSIRNFYHFFKLKGSIARNLYIRMDESRPDFAKKSLRFYSNTQSDQRREDLRYELRSTNDQTRPIGMKLPQRSTRNLPLKLEFEERFEIPSKSTDSDPLSSFEKHQNFEINPLWAKTSSREVARIPAPLRPSSPLFLVERVSSFSLQTSRTNVPYLEINEFSRSTVVFVFQRRIAGSTRNRAITHVKKQKKKKKNKKKKRERIDTYTPSHR